MEGEKFLGRFWEMVFGGGGGDFGVRADSGRACREGQESMRHPHADLRSFQAKIAAEVRPQTPSVFDNFAQTRGGIASGPASAAGTSIADADAERGACAALLFFLSSIESAQGIASHRQVAKSSRGARGGRHTGSLLGRRRDRGLGLALRLARASCRGALVARRE